ncbi:FMN-dependent NADH-azoreductase [Actinoplanes friuliensis]|jgi:FMN-dependent NADH-azoreductase|uniref:Putative acyl carrier protein phosphodiesterase n=1 Tax=Actinoplanes friuliensis DSM 7358 TaxID=1246995 RepID=U5W179_9ACTN|nr:NAD(P)H-dependent oxidoreductase [Actinoplanes friuliensis]AGZ42899.1 putative acyl carrier protein phosphodiesterase [Actinoplanes friuliensis DSM 7358]
MSTVFRLDSSIRGEGSVTRAVADTLESALVADLDGAAVLRREIGLTPLDAAAWGLSAFAGYVPEDQRSPEQVKAMALATELADELVAAEAYVFAVPFYNFGVSQHVKAWVDLLMTEPRFAPGTQSIAGRPAFLVIARGGGYGAGTPREGWDHATAWLTRVFSDIWGLDLQIIESELTLADVNPAMAELRELAATNLEEAHNAAHKHGKRLAVVLSAA